MLINQELIIFLQNMIFMEIKIIVNIRPSLKKSLLGIATWKFLDRRMEE